MPAVKEPVRLMLDKNKRPDGNSSALDKRKAYGLGCDSTGQSSTLPTQLSFQVQQPIGTEEDRQVC